MNDNHICNLPVDYKEKLDRLIGYMKENKSELQSFQILEQIFDQLPNIYSTYNLKLPDFISWTNLKTELILNILLDLEYNCSPIIAGDNDICMGGDPQSSYESPKAFRRAFSKWLDRESHTTPSLLYDFICGHYCSSVDSLGRVANYYPKYGHVLIPFLIRQSMKHGARVPYTHTGLWGLPFDKLLSLKDEAMQLINNLESMEGTQKNLMFYQIEKLFDFNFMEELKLIIEEYAAFHKNTFGSSYNLFKEYDVEKKYYISGKTGAYVTTFDPYKLHPIIYIMELSKIVFTIPSISVKNDIMEIIKKDARYNKYKRNLFEIYKEDLFYHLRILVPLLQASAEYIVYKISEDSVSSFAKDIKKCFAVKKYQYTDKQVISMFRQKTLCELYIICNKNLFINKMFLKNDRLGFCMLHEAMQVNITYLMYNYQNENFYFPYSISSQNMEDVLRELQEDNKKTSELRLANSFNNAYNSFFPFNEIYSRYLCLSNYWYQV